LNVTISASVTIGFESWSISFAGVTRTKIARSGRMMKANVRTIAKKYANASAARPSHGQSSRRLCLLAAACATVSAAP
jgi:hypothetical protein